MAAEVVLVTDSTIGGVELVAGDNEVVLITEQGPQGATAAVLEGDIDGDLTSATTQVLYTATQNTVIQGVILRIMDAPTGTPTDATVRFARSVGGNYINNTRLYNFVQREQVWYQPFGPGVIWLLEAGQTLNMIVATASTGDSHQVKIDVLGVKV